MKSKFTGLVLIAVLFLGMGSAWASVVTVDYGSLYSYNSQKFGTLQTAQFSLTVDGFSTYGFCVDPINSIEKGTFSYKILDWTPDYLQAAWLMDQYAPTQNVIDTRRETVGIQSSIWSAVTNLNYAPKFSFFNADLRTYNSFMKNLPEEIMDQLALELQSQYKILVPYLMSSDQKIEMQALIVKYSSPVPVPAAALLLGAGLLGIVGIRRRQSV